MLIEILTIWDQYVIVPRNIKNVFLKSIYCG